MSDAKKEVGIIYISKPALEPFLLTPRAMVEYDDSRPLRPTARLVRLYIHDLSRRPNWKIYVSQIQRALGLSEFAWSTARKELEQQGYYRAIRARAAGGKWDWQHFAFEEPVPAGELTIPHFPMDGSAMDGKVGDKRSTTPHRKTKQKAAAPRVRSAAGAAASPTEKKARRVRPSGIVCWTQDDSVDSSRIESDASAQEVREGVEEQVAAGKEPLPGLVWKSIQRARSARHSAARAATRAASGPLAQARRKKDEIARLDADPAARAAVDAAMRRAAAELGLGVADAN